VLIKKDDRIEKGIFVIHYTNYKEFINNYPFFLVNDKTELITKQLASTSFPLLVLDNFIYFGNFLNSKNLYQLKSLGINSILSLLVEEDKELKKMFNNYNFLRIDEENHAEVDFIEAIDLLDAEREMNKVPILLYCFSGQSVSIAICIAYLMKYKKWSLEFSTGYMMKLCPNFKVPSWLYTQLLRLNIKKLHEKK
jgi:hypothetical protein